MAHAPWESNELELPDIEIEPLISDELFFFPGDPLDIDYEALFRDNTGTDVNMQSQVSTSALQAPDQFINQADGSNDTSGDNDIVMLDIEMSHHSNLGTQMPDIFRSNADGFYSTLFQPSESRSAPEQALQHQRTQLSLPLTSANLENIPTTPGKNLATLQNQSPGPPPHIASVAHLRSPFNFDPLGADALMISSDEEDHKIAAPEYESTTFSPSPPSTPSRSSPEHLEQEANNPPEHNRDDVAPENSSLKGADDAEAYDGSEEDATDEDSSQEDSSDDGSMPRLTMSTAPSTVTYQVLAASRALQTVINAEQPEQNTKRQAEKTEESEPEPKRRKILEAAHITEADTSGIAIKDQNLCVSSNRVIKKCVCGNVEQVMQPRDSFRIFRTDFEKRQSDSGGKEPCSAEVEKAWKKLTLRQKAMYQARAAKATIDHERKDVVYEYELRAEFERDFGNPSCTCGAYRTNVEASEIQQGKKKMNSVQSTNLPLHDKILP